MILPSFLEGEVALFDIDYESAKHCNLAESEQTTDVTAWMDGDAEFDLESSDEIAVDLM